MTILTIFSSPKPFIDPHTTIIQKNAIRSWKALGENVQVILIGDEEGLSEFCQELNITHLPDVETNQKGVPKIRSMFRIAEEASDADTMVYVNADIILFPDIVDTVQKVVPIEEEFLLVGKRTNLDVDSYLDFSRDWKSDLKQEIGSHGEIHNHTGSDYFIYTKGLLDNIPDFVVGRAGWDNWMIYNGVVSPWKIIDTTESILAVHQNHDYKHIKEPRKVYQDDDSLENVRLAGGYKKMYTLLEVEHCFRDGKINRKQISLPAFLRKIEMMLTTETLAMKGFRWRLLRMVRKLIRKLINE